MIRARRSYLNRLLYLAGVNSRSPPPGGSMPLGRRSVLLVLAAVLASSSSLVAQQRTRIKPHRTAPRFLHPELMYGAPLLHRISPSAAASITEVEPNNSAATATHAALG